jgi:hypothetical protein
VDAFVVVREKRVVLEAECSADRIGNDLAKLRELGAHISLIIVPHARLQRWVRMVLGKLSSAGEHRPLDLHVLTLGAALRWIFTHCPPADPRPTAGGLYHSPHHEMH